jgi:hypothetical protein
MAEGTRVEIPKNLAEEAEKLLSLSGFASLNDASRSILRKWIDDAKKAEVGPTKSERLSENTAHALFPQWMINYRRNLDDIDKGKDMLALADKYKDCKTAIVIGAGPSVQKYNHLKMLADARAQGRYKGVVLATDRILIPCLKAGLIPDIVMSLDGDFEVSEFFKHDLVNKHAHEMDVLFSAVVDNATVKMWPSSGNVYFFLPHIDTMEGDMSVSRGMFWMTNKTVMHTGGNVGAACWFLSVAMNKDPIALIGMDLSYPDVENIEEIPSFGIYEKMHNGDPEKILKCFRRDYNPFFKNETITDYIMETYWEVFKSYIDAIHAAHGLKTINCTGGGRIHDAQGVECMYLDNYVEPKTGKKIEGFLSKYGGK